MFQIIFAVIILAAAGAESKSFTISGPTWQNEISACWSGGFHSRNYTYYLGQISSYNTTFAEVTADNTTWVVAEGDLQLKTGKLGWLSKSELRLKQAGTAKVFTNSWSVTSNNWFAEQTVTMILTVTFYRDGTIYLNSYVSADSSWAMSCAETKAYVDRIWVSL